MSMTPRLQLPFIVAGQAQKEVTHNEALQRLDMLVQATCAAGPSNAPPINPQTGVCYLCGSAPTGDWAGHANALAQWTSAGWRFALAIEGTQIASAGTGLFWQFLDGGWSLGIVEATEIRIDGARVLGPRLSPITGAEGGTTIDVQARATIDAILIALEAHGLISAG